jgi:hypothetical protein
MALVCIRGTQILAGIGNKLGAAAGTAEIVSLITMLCMMRCLRRIDCHPADRVFDAGGGGLPATVRAATASGMMMLMFHRELLCESR